MSQRSLNVLILAAVVAWGVTGCGPARPATLPATGEVTYNGQPVSGAQVMFLSPDGRPANATTDAAGKFTLTTFEEGDGALPGTHQVTINKHTTLPSTPENPYPQSKNELPARYGRADLSQLTAEVKSGDENHFRFELTD